MGLTREPKKKKKGREETENLLQLCKETVLVPSVPGWEEEEELDLGQSDSTPGAEDNVVPGPSGIGGGS